MERYPLELLVLKRGSSGCTVFSRDGRTDVPAFPIQEVDPTGSGRLLRCGVPLRTAGREGSAGVGSPRLRGRRAQRAGLRSDGRKDQPAVSCRAPGVNTLQFFSDIVAAQKKGSPGRGMLGMQRAPGGG